MRSPSAPCDDVLDLVVDVGALLVQLLHWHAWLRLEEDEGQNLVALERDEVLHGLGLFHPGLGHLLAESDLLALQLLLEIQLQLIDVILLAFLQLLISSHLGAIAASLGRACQHICLVRFRRGGLIAADL